MLRKVFRTGNSVVVSLPKDALELFGISVGTEVSVDLDRENKQIVISPIEEPLAEAGVDEAFAQQVTEFMCQRAWTHGACSQENSASHPGVQTGCTGSQYKRAVGKQGVVGFHVDACATFRNTIRIQGVSPNKTPLQIY